VPAYYWLVVNDWLVLPLTPSSRPCPDTYTALTCMYRDMQSNVIDLHETKALLHRESVRLDRNEMLDHAAARKPSRAAKCPRRCSIDRRSPGNAQL
jgi:hypothetical protein